jgi:uridine kinase
MSRNAQNTARGFNWCAPGYKSRKAYAIVRGMSLKGTRLEKETVRLTELSKELHGLPRRARTLLVGIDGCSGSGKSSFALALADHLPGAAVLPADGFIISQAGTPEIDWSRLLTEVVTPLGADRQAVYRYFSWWSNSFSEERTVPPGGVVIVEGCFVLHEKVRPYLDFKIWLQCPIDVAIGRCIERDGPRSKGLWEEAHKPAERMYLEKQRPFVFADVIVDSFEGRDFRVCDAFTRLHTKSAVVLH